MVRKFIPLLLVVFLLAVFPLAGCSNSSVVVIDPIKLVPNKANMLGLIDITSVLQDDNLTGIYDRVLKDTSYTQSFYDALSKLKDEYNIDLMGFQEGLFFAEVSGPEAQVNYSGVIVEGTFNKNDLVAAIQSASGAELTIIKYKDYDIYTNELQESAIAFLDANTLVIGEMQPVKDVIDVEKGDAKALSGEVLDTYNQLGSALIKLAIVTPPGVAEGQLGQSASQLLGNLSAFDKIKTVGMALSKNGQSVVLNLKLCTTDSDSARSVEQNINGLITFAKLLTGTSGNQQQKQTLDTVLNNIKVTRSDTCVNVNITATLSEIEELVQGSGQSA
jgi:hypothetical protein